MNGLRKLLMLLVALGVIFAFYFKADSDDRLGSSHFKDPRDGTVYKTVQIGDQVWMADNLRATKYKDGTPIPRVISSSGWEALSGTQGGAYCAYEGADSNAQKYGYLYNWYAVNDSRGLAPEGWRVPTDDDWMQLEMALGMSYSEADQEVWRGTDEGSKMKSDSGWYAAGNGTNESGFSALPGGARFGNGNFYLLTTSRAYFWSASETSSSCAWFRELYYDYGEVCRDDYGKGLGFSVRCVKDN